MRQALLGTAGILGIMLTATAAALLFQGPCGSEFCNTGSIQRLTDNPAYAHFEVQWQQRDVSQWVDVPDMQAPHGLDGSPPPATHLVSTALDETYVTANHFMTAVNGSDYGLIYVTPDQITNCTVQCVITWNQSTFKASIRDWTDVYVIPWADSEPIPFISSLSQDVDMQAPPQNAIHIGFDTTNNAPILTTIVGGNQTDITSISSMSSGIPSTVDQQKAREPFKLTITPGHVRFERLPYIWNGISIPGVVFFDQGIATTVATQMVVTWGQHSYNPTKDGAGVPAGWHWDAFDMTPSAPFTLIHTTTPHVVLTGNGGAVTFQSPAPAGALLRFTAIGSVIIDGVPVSSVDNVTHIEHASNYVVPIAQGTTSVNIGITQDSWLPTSYNGAKDFTVFSLEVSSPSSPTPTATSSPLPATPTATPTVQPSPTAIATATPTNTPSPTPLPSTATPTATSTPIPTDDCARYWGTMLVHDYGQLTQAECEALP